MLSREAFKEAPPAPAGGIRAVVFDWDVGNGVATLVAFEDGTTSLYLSSGGGVIGAGAHESVRRAAAALRVEAARTISHFHPAQQYPLPTSDQPGFYVITDGATLGSGLFQTEELHRADHPLSALARLAQDVIAAVRQSSYERSGR